MANQRVNQTSSYLLIDWVGGPFPTRYPQPYLISTDNIVNIVTENVGGGGIVDNIVINYFTRHNGVTPPKVELNYVGGLSLNDAVDTINSLIVAVIASQQYPGTKWDPDKYTSALGNTLATITVVP